MVRAGDVIAEIETEKIAYELEATADGIVHPLAKDGATLPVDGLLGYLLRGGRSGARARRRAAGAKRRRTRQGIQRDGRCSETGPSGRAPGQPDGALDAGRAAARRPAGR